MKKKTCSNWKKIKTFFWHCYEYKYTILTESTASIVSVWPTHSGSSEERDILSADVGSQGVEVSEGGRVLRVL